MILGTQSWVCRDSGPRWLAAERQLRHIFEVISGATPKIGRADYWGGNMLWATPEDLGKLEGYWLRHTRRMITHAGYESCKTTLARPNSVVLTRRTPIGQVALLASEACSSQDCFLLVPRCETDTRFYFYWFTAQSELLRLLGRGSTLATLSIEDLKALKIPHPPLCEQRLVADYLDRESARIDLVRPAAGHAGQRGGAPAGEPGRPCGDAVPSEATFSRAFASFAKSELAGHLHDKERVLNLLAEKRWAQIMRTTTEGLGTALVARKHTFSRLGHPVAQSANFASPNIPFREGIPHWRTDRAKWLFRKRDQRLNASSTEILSVSGLRGVTRRSEMDFDMLGPETAEGYKICLSGDLVVKTLGASMGAMGVSPVDGIVSPAHSVFELGASVHPGYIDALVRLPVFSQEVERYTTGVSSSRLRLSAEGFFEISFPVPPLTEQQRIAVHIANETAKLDKLRAKAEATVALLRERRAALIAAAVAGKIDRETVARSLLASI